MAKKLAAQFVCQECGNVEARWSGRCGNCGAWNSFLEEQPATMGGSRAGGGGKKLEAAKLSQITQGRNQNRLKTGIAEVDQVVGGGIVPGSVLLLAGEPGIGKSTLLLQLAQGLA